MGMEHHTGPRRRRLGSVKKALQTIRLTAEAREMAEAMRSPGFVFPDGCALGDVIEAAIMDVGEPDGERFLTQFAPFGDYFRRHRGRTKSCQTSVQLSTDAKRRLFLVSETVGLSRADVIEAAVRLMAKRKQCPHPAVSACG